MPEIKWIKITTEMFDDEKVRIIEALPEADTLIVLWIRLICMAGKTNDNGYIYLTPELPFTIEQLAAVFNRPLQTVRLAIETFSKLQMITLSEDGVIFLPNFEKHQNIEGMERVRENTRRRVAALRVRQQIETPKLLPSEAVTLRSVTVTGQNRIDKNRIDKNRIDVYSLWLKVKELLKNEMNKQNYGMWIEDSEGLMVENSILYVGVRNETVAEHLGKHLRGLVRRCMYQVQECNAKEVDFIVVEGEKDVDEVKPLQQGTPE